MRSSILTAAIAVAISSLSVNAVAATHKVHRHHTTTVQTVTAESIAANQAAELRQRDEEISALKTEMSNLEAKVATLEERTDAQSDINVSNQQNVEKLQADVPRVDKIEKLVNNTSVGGKAYIDVSGIEQKKNGVKTAATGNGLDVKRFYLTVNHQFNDIWSANLTTDFNYISADGETQLFIKKAYLQGKFSDAFVFRAGSADMPWIPYVENLYGFRYVEKTLTDRLSFGNSADWGLNASGKVAGIVDYSVSGVDGGGFKNPTRTKRMDFEGRVGFTPFDNAVIAVGGYSGTLGKETQLVNAKHTADRVDFLAAYAKGNTRFGAEYFQAKNWNNVLTTATDKSDGYALWGSYGLGEMATIFARYDHAHTSKDLDPSLTDKYFNAGVEFALTKGLKIAAVYKNEDLKDHVNNTKTQELGVFGEVSF